MIFGNLGVRDIPNTQIPEFQIEKAIFHPKQHQQQFNYDGLQPGIQQVVAPHQLRLQQ
jgi:hypothetical protein